MEKYLGTNVTKIHERKKDEYKANVWMAAYSNVGLMSDERNLKMN